MECRCEWEVADGAGSKFSAAGEATPLALRGFGVVTRGSAGRNPGLEDSIPLG